MKLHIKERYKRHMVYVKNSDHMANSYLMSRCTFKWTMKLLFYLLDLTVLNSWILLSSHGTNYIHRDFRLLLVRNLNEVAGKSQDHPTPDWLEDQVQLQQMFCDSRAAITNNGQQNHLPNSTVVCVLLTAREKARCISAPDLTCAHA